jgi:hypothetical protein
LECVRPLGFPERPFLWSVGIQNLEFGMRAALFVLALSST